MVDRCFLLVMGGMLTFNFTNDVVKIGEFGLQRHDYYRFTALETRDGDLQPSSPGISTFGVDRKQQSPLWMKNLPPSRVRMEVWTLSHHRPPVSNWRRT